MITFSEYDAMTKEQLAQELSRLVSDGLTKTQEYKMVESIIAKRENDVELQESAHEKFVPEETPLKTLVDFSEILKLFDNTHDHLGCFDMIDKELALIGGAYYPIKKALCYYVESLRQKTFRFAVGRVMSDNRIHFFVKLGAGRGKGQIKNVIKKYKLSKYERAVILPGERINIEQLIGRITKGAKGVMMEERGYLNYKAVVVDECDDLFSEIEATYAQTMLELRNGMDIFGKNTVHKKLTADELIEYDPEFRLVALLHNANFTAKFFDTGTGRRLFGFEGGTDLIPASAAWSGLLEAETTSELRDYINTRNDFIDSLVFSPEAVMELKEWLEMWTGFVLANPNQRVRSIGQRTFTSVKELFMRLCAILSVSRNEKTVSKDTTTRACADAVQFLLCTYQLYANRGRINLSRDMWQTGVEEEAMVFEWLHYNRATSQEASRLTIANAQTHIGEVFGVQDRQARGILNKLVERGLLGKKQVGKTGSVVWLAFTPQTEGGVEMSVFEQVDLKSFITNKMEILRGISLKPINEGGKDGNGNPLIIKREEREIDGLTYRGVDMPTLATLNQEKLRLSKEILELISQGKDGIILSAEPGKWQELYKGFPNALRSEVDRAMRDLLGCGDIWEARPGLYKVVHAGKVNE